MKASLAYYRKIFVEADRSDKPGIYLLQGSERFIMEEMARRVTDSLVPDDMRSFNLTVAYGEDIDINAFITTASSFPFLSDRRVLVLKELERLRGGWKNLIEYCMNPVSSTVLVLIFNTHDGAGRRIRLPRDYRKLESAVERSGKVIRFDRLPDADIKRWVLQKTKKLGLDADRSVSEALLESVGGNLFELQNELEKLALLFGNEKLTRDHLKQTIGSYRVNAVYDFIDAVRPGSEAAAIKMVSRIIRTGAERPSVVVYHLIRHFLALLKIKAGYSGSGYRYDRLRKKARLFRTREILTWLENLRITELLMKSTSFPEEILITGAVLHSMRGTLLGDRDESWFAA